MSTSHVTIVPDEMKPIDAYRLLLSVVVPRPIAWISTVGRDGKRNLAPYSFFNGVNGVPPVIMISVAGTRTRREKDTLRNVRETGEFVVNLVDEPLARAMNTTSGDWPYETDEFLEAGLASAPSTDVSPPRVAAAPAAMEARLLEIIPVKDTASTMVLGRVVRFHVREDLLRPEGLVDAARMRPVSRLGGDEYGTFGEVFAMKRPRVT